MANGVSYVMTDDYFTGDLPDTPLSSAQKSLRLLELLADSGRSLGVSEVARLVGGSRGTVHKQLAGMVALGWVEQDADGRYRLTLKVARIGNAALDQAGLGQRIREVLAQLAERTRETVSIAAMADDAALIVQRAESTQVLHADIRVGTRVGLNGGASGLILAAFALDREERETLRGRGVAVASEERLGQVHADGFVYTVDQVAPGISAGSVPLYDATHFQTVALTISGPTDRLIAAEVEAHLREGRELITRAITGESARRHHSGAPAPIAGADRRGDRHRTPDIDRGQNR